MPTVSGVVTEVLSFPSKYEGGKPMITLVVNGTKYGLGKQPNTSKVGDVVTFEAAQKGQYWNVDGPVTKSSEASPKVLAAEQAANPSGGKNQEVISRQAANNTAIDYLNLLHLTDSLPLPAKKGDREAALKLMLEDYRDYFLDYAKNGTTEGARGAGTQSGVPKASTGPAPAGDNGEWKD